jgi:hypothetical protein
VLTLDRDLWKQNFSSIYEHWDPQIHSISVIFMMRTGLWRRKPQTYHKSLTNFMFEIKAWEFLFCISQYILYMYIIISQYILYMYIIIYCFFIFIDLCFTRFTQILEFRMSANMYVLGHLLFWHHIITNVEDFIKERKIIIMFYCCSTHHQLRIYLQKSIVNAK